MVMPLLVRFSELAGTASFHVAQLPTRGAGRSSGMPHVRDFHEFVLVRAGVAEHRMTGRSIEVAAGDVTLLRPDDLHTFVAIDDSGFDLVSVTFPSVRWHGFCELAGIVATEWDGPQFPPVYRASATRVPDAFDEVRHRAVLGRRPVDLVAFLSEVTGRLTVLAEDRRATPDWLTEACAVMDSEDGLRAGVPRMVAVAAVSHGHLTRTMTALLGIPPAEFVSRRRLERASLLLTTTDEPVGRVAARCGYSSQSYFARRFVLQFGIAPREYRVQARQVT